MKGGFSETDYWDECREEVFDSVRNVYWPPESGKFVVHPEENVNGVNPITEQFENNLDSKPGWQSTGRRWLNNLLQELGILDDALEKLHEYYDDPLEFISSPWFDAMKQVGDESELVVAEWETGNISSSHRSLNRITLGLVAGIIAGGFIVLPNRGLYYYLTDRIGNYRELEPYFLIWESLAYEVENGIIEVIVVEHDGVSNEVPPIGKLTDGMADREVPDVDQMTSGREQQAGLEDY